MTKVLFRSLDSPLIVARISGGPKNSFIAEIQSPFSSWRTQGRRNSLTLFPSVSFLCLCASVVKGPLHPRGATPNTKNFIDLPFTLCKPSGATEFPISEDAFGLGPSSLSVRVCAWCCQDDGECTLQIREPGGPSGGASGRYFFLTVIQSGAQPLASAIP